MLEQEVVNAPASSVVDVAAAALINEQGEILIAQRPEGKHMAGFWEFPGGKLEPNESVADALSRELLEEIAVVPTISRPLITLEHAYPEKTVRLHVFVVSDWKGEVRSAEGQALKWVAASQLPEQQLLPADKPIADALRLPPIIGITSDGRDVDGWCGIVIRQSARLGERLDVLKAQRLVARGVKPLNLLRTTGGLSVLALESDIVDRMTYSDFAFDSNPLHLKSSELWTYSAAPRTQWLSASVHSIEELQQAEKIGCDFVLLGSVNPTASHPDVTPLGWEGFSKIVSQAHIPVYALGGCGMEHLLQAWNAGAQGVAGISGFCDESGDSFAPLNLKSAAG